MTVKRIISGAQTGADHAGLDAALELSIEVGGFVPLGCQTESGILSDEQMTRYNLIEMATLNYADRTRQNILASDGTVIFGDAKSAGSALTITFCVFFRKPCLVNPTAAELRAWLAAQEITTLNVAGNRESKNPGIYDRTKALLIEALSA